jgi:EAL domain-containing protein (putative c-di-GMP-specific phosphodiesterase class I)
MTVPVLTPTSPEPALAPIPEAAANDDTAESDAPDDVELSRPPLPALLRRTLASATEQLGCAFGTVVTAHRPFTLSHRISTEESDLIINSAIEAVRTHMLRLMAVRDEPLILNNVAPGRTQFGSYKLLALPLRLGGCGPLIALIVLFRNCHARDFASADVDSLMLSALQIPDESLAEFAPEPAAVSAVNPPVLRTVVQATPPPAPPAPMTMDMRVRSALRDDKFNLYVQSISPLRNEQRPARFEVLLRMRDSQTIHAPSAFFGAAAASSLMPDVDRWVIRNLLAKLRENASTVRSGHWEFCINLAAQSLIADRFSEFVIAEVCRSAIPAGLLVFEISEASAFEHQHALEHFGARMRDVGCRIALDNCREGLGTFGVMHRWPVSCVKIDGSVIRNVLNNPRSASMVRDVARHAAARGIETVAECVEAAPVRDKLLDIGIDYAQGFHYGQPQPIATLFA